MVVLFNNGGSFELLVIDNSTHCNDNVLKLQSQKGDLNLYFPVLIKQ